MKSNAPNETNDKVERFGPFWSFGVEKDTKAMLVRDQVQEKMVRRGRYEEKLRRICENSELAKNLARELNHGN